jgi:hypothetical protein
MSGIPHEQIPGGLEDVMQCDGKFGHSEASSEVPADLGDHVNVTLPDLRRERLQFIARQLSKIGG